MATANPVSDESEALYTRCKDLCLGCDEGFTKIFTQTELLELCDSEPLDNIKGGHGLLPLVTELSASKLFITLKSKGGGSTWSLRRREIAKLLRTLTRDEYMVYEIIEEAYESGIWIKNIKKRSGINDGKSMEKLIAKLVRLSLIKTVKNVKAPAQKTYMLFHLAPSDDVTGGSFYDQGDLDESLVDTLSNVIVFHIRMASWVERRRSKRIKLEEKDDGDMAEVKQEDGTSSKAKGKKRKRDSATTEAKTIDIEDLISPRKHRSYKHTHDPETEPDTNGSAWLLHPAGTHEYPTAASVHQWVLAHNFLAHAKASTVSIEEIQNIINVLVWDGKLEECNGGYRSVRGVQPIDMSKPKDEQILEEDKRGNGLTEMPCGRCPVVDLCAPGALISAATCDYFGEWLNEGAAAAA